MIDKGYGAELRTKKRIFIENTKTRKSVFLTMITTFGLKKNTAQSEVVDQELTMNDLFFSHQG